MVTYDDDDEEFLRTIVQFWTVSFSLRTKVSQTLLCVLCITTNKYLVRVLVVLLHACFSVVRPIPFLLAAIFFPAHPYIGCTTVLPNTLAHTHTHTLTHTHILIHVVAVWCMGDFIEIVLTNET